MKVKTYNLQSNVEQEELDAGLLAESYVVETTDGKALSLPSVFESEIREDLVRSAVHASELTEGNHMVTMSMMVSALHNQE